MKSPAAAAVILTFVLSVAFFQTCYSLRCYRCTSDNFDNQNCEQIANADYLIKCEFRNSACISTRLNGPENNSGLIRDCVQLKKLVEYKKAMDIPSETGLAFESFICNSDGCNNDF